MSITIPSFRNRVFSCGMVFVCATAFHSAMTLVCETKTRFLMPFYVQRPNGANHWSMILYLDSGVFETSWLA